jgi:hypothetical protein
MTGRQRKGTHIDKERENMNECSIAYQQHAYITLGCKLKKFLVHNFVAQSAPMIWTNPLYQSSALKMRQHVPP